MTDAESVVRSFYSGLARGESAAALALLNPKIEWTEAERSPYYSGTVVGVDAIVESVFMPIGRDFDGFACTPEDFISDAQHTVSIGLYTGRAKASGSMLRAPFVHVWTVKDGTITRFVQHTDSALWAEAFAVR